VSQAITAERALTKGKDTILTDTLHEFPNDGRSHSTLSSDPQKNGHSS
jgi:hypothetical protein